MDFLDDDKERQHRRRLYFGYCLMAFALTLATIIAVYLAYGFTLDKSGQVIQNGLVFFSSAPNGGEIYLNGKDRGTTNARLALVAGQYKAEIQRSGYQSWQRAITVEGGSVQHFDYPFLVPTTLRSSTLKTLEGAVGFSTQSRDRRWLVVSQPATPESLLLYDLNNRNDDPKPLAISDSIVSGTSETSTWEIAEWSTDNRHFLVRHTYDISTKPSVEYLLLDRQTPASSLNLTQTLKLTDGAVPSLINGAYDQYYVFNAAARTLERTTLKQPALVPVLTHVLSFKAYGKDTLLYATTTDAKANMINVRLVQDGATYTIRTLPVDTAYLLNMATYDGDWYVAAGVPSESKVYVYKNPVSELKADKDEPAVPIHTMRVSNPDHIAFSTNTRFLMIEHGQEFYVYDAENDKSYRYTTKLLLDAPQTHATWMDGHRLTYISNGKAVMLDFDDVNERTLVTTLSNSLPYFDRDYEYLYTLSATSTDKSQTVLSRTPLKTANDL